IAVRFIAYVSRQQLASAAFRLHETLCLFRVAVLVVIADQQVRAFLGVGDSHCPADTAVAPGDHRHPALELAGCTITVFAAFWLGVHFGLQAGLPILLLRRQRLTV